MSIIGNCKEIDLPRVPSVSIVIPVSIPDNIKRCLQSLRRTKYSNMDIVIAVNNDLPTVVAKTVANIKEETNKFPQSIECRIVAKHETLGYARACNIGFRHSTGQYVVFLNDDVVVEPDWIRELVKIGEKDCNIACVQPKILSLRDSKMFDYAGAAGGFIDIYGIPFCAGRIFDIIEEDRGQYDYVKDIFWASGVALFCRSIIINEVGLFDEEFFSYMEEIDFAFKILHRGYKIVFAPSAKIYHLGSATVTKLKVNRDYLNYRNNFLMLLKNYELRDLLKIVVPRLFLDTLNFLNRLHEGDVKLAMNIPRAFFAVIVRMKYVLRERVSSRRLRRVNSNYIKKRILLKSIVILHKLGRIKNFQQIRNLIPCAEKEQ